MSIISNYCQKTNNIISHPIINLINSKGINIIKDIIYDNNNPYILKTDLYYSIHNTGKESPVFIIVHGNSPLDNNKEKLRGLAIAMARLDYFVLNINYSLETKYPFAYNVNNIISAINWLYNKRKVYNLDTHQFILCGVSFGAFMAAITAGANTNSQFKRQIKVAKCSIQLSSVILLNGLYNIESVIKSDSKSCYNSNIIEESVEKLKKRGLLYILHPDNYIDNHYPPSLICQYSEGSIYKESDKIFLNNLVKHSIKYDVLAMPRNNNCLNIKTSFNTHIDKINKFIKECSLSQQ